MPSHSYVCFECSKPFYCDFDSCDLARHPLTLCLDCHKKASPELLKKLQEFNSDEIPEAVFEVE